MILIRHGQSEFNAAFNRTGIDPGIIDAPLTEQGRAQVRRAADELRQIEAGRVIRRLLVSPYTRTLQTAAIIAEALDLPVEIDPLVREHALYQCDVGTPASRLSLTWPSLSFGHLAETWWSSLDETRAQLLERCRAFHRQAGSWADWREVVVISHWGFIRGLTGYEARNAELVSFDVSRHSAAALEHPSLQPPPIPV
ncbi:histidine phosphatase family protein [Dongia soli]|uniref:Histidine phosphatase family protein n=1 Tax=Dongia soli TaxID=600628 RepID=A0ABU5E8Q9_9PROT|nr:histidine phosphatase family protein [Dongia soli]MDY0881990.1 histidine phosphatase family protein [Dongia soli]